jgi:hypothetical protein
VNLDLVRMLASGAQGMIDSSVLGRLEGYAAASAGAFGMTLMILGQQLDDAAERLCEENAALRSLLGEAAPRVGGKLGDRLAAAASASDESLRVSVLQDGNDVLRALLIELHAWVEEAGDAAADLDAAIWSELLASTERRRVSLAPF